MAQRNNRKNKKMDNKNMTMEERVVLNERTALQGEDASVLRGGREMRRVSAESLAVLQMVGSPFAGAFNAALNGEDAGELIISGIDVNVMAWVHSAPEDEVLHVAQQCVPGIAGPAVEAACRWVRGWSLGEAAEVVKFALGEMSAVRAANFDAKAPELGLDSKKNAGADVIFRS